MPQATDYVIANDTHANVRADINTVLAASVGMNSGTTAPGTMYAHMLWADTTASPSIVSIRNQANSAWNQLFTDTGLFRAEDGTAAAVAYGPNSDIDTGMHFASAATVTLVTAGTHRLSVAASEIVFNDSGVDTDIRAEVSGNANAFFIQGSDGFLGLGTNAPAQLIESQRNSAVNWMNNCAVSSASGPGLFGKKARGTIASPAALSSADVIYQLAGQAYHSTGTPGYVTCVDIEFVSEGSESGNTVPTAILFRTMVAGGSLAEKVRLTNDGRMEGTAAGFRGMTHGYTAPAAGTGLEMYYDTAGLGTILSINRTTPAFLQLSIGGSPIVIGGAALGNGIISLGVGSTTSQVRLPTLTTTQRNALTAVAGTLIYNTSTAKLNVYTTAWEAITSA